MSDTEVYDRLAKVLRDVHERFPEDGFSKHQRLRGLLADHMQDADREIRIALDVIDEGVIDILTNSPAEELGMQTDRLVTRLDTSRGVREDIARQVIQAFTYALGLGELPSTLPAAQLPPVPPAAGADDWVGVSEVVQPDQPQPAPPAGGNNSQPADGHETAGGGSLLSKLGSGNNRYILIAVAVVLGLYLLMPRPEAPQPQQPEQPKTQEPAQPQPAQKPQPADPQPQPAVQPQVNPGNTPNQPNAAVVQQQWYDPYGNVWNMRVSNTQFEGYNSNPNNPAYGMTGMIDPNSGMVVYELYNRGGQLVGQGQGQYSDQTHIDFTTLDVYGNLAGQGQLHINHAPR